MQNKDILLDVESIDSLDATLLLGELSAALKSITGNGGETSFYTSDMADARARFVVARDAQGNALGCGAIRPMDAESAELKRMYSRGTCTGIGAAILCRLEQEATNLGYRSIKLETRVVNQKAVSFYLRNHYQIIPNYGKYVGRDEAVCFEKHLNCDDFECAK